MSVDIKHHLPEALKDIGTFVALGVRPAVNNNRKHTIVSTTNVAKCIVHFHLLPCHLYIGLLVMLFVCKVIHRGYPHPARA